jgi:arylsulfatase A
MKLRIRSYLAAGAGILATQSQAVGHAGGASRERPNIVFFLIDDLSHYGVTAYGADRITSDQGIFTNESFSTPRIDSLAKDGLRCDYAYAHSVCEPTRVALMTGMSNRRNFIQPKALHESQITFGDVFQKEGYATCMVGKWKQSRGTKEVPGKDYVYQFGWDEFLCFDVIGEGRRMIEPWMVENGTPRSFIGIDPVTGRRYYGPQLINRYALDFIDRHRDEPFFLYYPMLLVHDEHTPTPDTRPKALFDEFDIEKPAEFGSMKGDERIYFPDMLKYMDKMVGKVLDKLEELGLSGNTLVVVMGDNGTKECFSHVLPDGSVYPGGKGGTAENGIRVPLLLRWPNVIPAGQAYTGLVDITDIYPTLADAAGIAIPNKKELDGISFWDQARAKASNDHRDAIYHWYNANNPMTDQEHLLQYAFTQEFKRYAPHKGFPNGRFFDLRNDPLEREGEPVIKYKWNDWHHSGVNPDSLTPEQEAAYKYLGRVLDRHRYQPVQQMRILVPEDTVQVGSSCVLECEVIPKEATLRSVIWQSSNPSIASIDKFGRLTAHRAGDVEVTAWSWDSALPVASNAKQAFLTEGVHSSVLLTILP